MNHILQSTPPEHSSHAGAMDLALRLDKYWEGKAEFRVEPVGIIRPDNAATWAVRSNLINGLPPS